MRFEVPDLKRCCFCIPLRYGLLAWSYLIMLPITFSLYEDIIYCKQIIKNNHQYNWMTYTRLALSLISRAGDLAITFFLIIAAHKKSARLLKVYYTCGLTLAFLNSAIVLHNTLYDLLTSRELFHTRWFWKYLALIFLFGVVYIAMQLYIIVLVRSEIIKLESSCKFQFSNMAAAAESADRSLYEADSFNDDEHGISEDRKHNEK